MTFRVTAAHPYDNWRYDFDNLSEALAFVSNDHSFCIHNVTEFSDKKIKETHGTWRAGKRYADLTAVVTNPRS